MSWWIYLEDKDGETVNVERHSEGGTYCVGGAGEACLNVTYNYGKHFDFDVLNEKTGEETIPVLMEAMDKLNDDRDSDYWAATEGNARHTCLILLSWARQHPDAVWDVH